MSNVIVFPIRKSGERSKSNELDVKLKTDAMESARDHIREAFTRLAVIQAELARGRTSDT